MKKGKTINELAHEITRQQNSKRDFLVPANKIRSYVFNDTLEIGFPIKDNDAELYTAPLNSNGHNQLSTYCGIPKKYYDTMLAHPNLLQTNVQHWLDRSNDKRMVRSLDGEVRAFLSDKYRRLDNFDLAQNVLPMLIESKAEIESCEITENRIYIKAITHRVQAEIRKGDVVSAGIIVSNSETGNGSLSVKPMILRLVCDNGAIADDYAMRKYHAGRNDLMSDIEFSNETITAEDKAFWLKVRDLVRFSLEEATFNKVVQKMYEACEMKIENPEKAIELVSKKYNLKEEENGNVLKWLIQGGDLTSYGLGNAVTRMAQDVESYDRSTELESIGFQIMCNKW